jgi:uncharacterized protein (TIGR03435 family)
MRCGLSLTALAAVVLIAQQLPSFEVASVKPSANGARRSKSDRQGYQNAVRFVLRDATLKSLILRAYTAQDYQLSGGPDWMDSNRFDIEAKPPQAASEEQMLLMLRSLLAERFHLSIRREVRPKGVYLLTLAKGGPKLGPYFHRIAEGEQYPPADGRLQLGGPMSMFVFLLQRNMQSPADSPPILDRTGLTGAYSILVSNNGREDWPALLEDQLGLKLELRKEPMEMLIVEHAAKPTAN